MDEIRTFFEEWYESNNINSNTFERLRKDPNQYKDLYIQEAWLAFKAGYARAQSVALDAMKMYIENKYKK